MNGTTNSWCTSHSSHFFINFGLAEGAFCATIQVIDEGIKQYQTQLSHFGYTTTRLHLDFVSLVTVFWACFSRSFFSLSHYLVFCQPVYDAAGGSFKYYNIEVNNIHCFFTLPTKLITLQFYLARRLRKSSWKACACIASWLWLDLDLEIIPSDQFPEKENALESTISRLLAKIIRSLDV